MQTGGTLNDNLFTFPPNIANGTIKLVEFPNGLQAVISDYILTSDFVFHRLSSLPEVFIIRADYITMEESFEARTEKEVFIDDSSIYANILMHSSRSSLEVLVKEGTKVQSTGVLIKPSWFSTYFPGKIASFWLNYIHVLCLKGVNMVPLNFDARQSVFSMLALKPDHPAYLIMMQARLFELLDYYYKQVIRLVDAWKNLSKMMDDVDKIIELDISLTADFSKPLPRIEEMAESVGMSPTKLKSLFKKIYNQPLYEYLNVSRLLKARQMIFDNGASIKEISAVCGYKSVQHFTSSFKKQFSITPGDLLHVITSKK